MKYELIAETYDWICQESAEKARHHMQSILNKLSPNDNELWGRAWVAWSNGDDIGDNYLYVQEIQEACTESELIGLNGWQETPNTGHCVTIAALESK